MKSPKHLSFLLVIAIENGPVNVPIHILYSSFGFFNQNLEALHVYHPQPSNISGLFDYNVSQSIFTYYIYIKYL
jgi:hypothetical protein